METPDDALHGDAPSLVEVAVIARTCPVTQDLPIVNTQEAAVMEIH